MFHKLSLVFTAFFFLFHASAQEYSHSHYDTKDGLAGSVAYCLSQSADGFIWIGTETGLSRFDGTQFRNYTMADGLPSNEILGIFIDTKNRVWLSPFKNAISYYYKGKIYNQQNDTTLGKVKLQSLVNCIAENDQGDIIIQEGDHTHIITPENKITTYPTGVIPGSSKAQGKNSIRTLKGQLSVSLITFPQLVRAQLNLNSYLTGVGTQSGSPCYVFRTNDTVQIIKPNGQQKQIKLPKNHKCLGSDNNVLSFHHLKGGVIVFDLENIEQNHRYFSDYVVLEVMKDREKNLWFATQGSGIFKISSNRFKNIFPVDPLKNMYIMDIKKIGNSIYVGAQYEQYWRFDAIDDRFFHSETKNKPDPFYADRNFLKKIPDGTFFNCGSSDFLHLNDLMLSPWPAVKTVLSIGDTLLMATFKGTFLVHERSGFVKLIYPGRATCAYRQGSAYYIGTLEGLYKVYENGQVQFMGNLIPQLKHQISCFAESEDGTLWIGCKGGGVVGYRNRKVTAIFNRSNGLSSDLCRSLFLSGHKLWVGTEKGLNKVDTRPGICAVTQNITTDDGLNSNIINTIYNDGDIVYVGTPVGVTVFNERNITRHSISEIRMTGVSVSGRQFDPLKPDLFLEHKDNNISFEYSGISFLSEGNILYKYRISGLDEQWKLTRAQTLNFPSLPSGVYTLQLIAINKYGDESVPLEYRFTIEKSIPEMLWFRILAVLVITSIIILVVRFAIRRTHKRQTKNLMIEQKIKSLEQMALRAQMNPHFIFNCLNSMQRYIIDGDIKKANFYLTRFAALVRETLDNAARVFISMEEEIRYLTNYIDLERLQIRDPFAYDIIVDPRIDRGKLMVPNMVLQPFIENAIKHGMDNPPVPGILMVSFTLREEEQVLRCVIEDNGPGIKHSMALKEKYDQQFSSKGMSITHKRILTLNQLQSGEQPIQIQVIDIGQLENGTGTRIIINLPIKYYDEEHNY